MRAPAAAEVLLAWLRGARALQLPWALAAGLLSAGLLLKALWRQYGILRHRGLPEHDLGLPLLGHTVTIFKRSLSTWGRELMMGRQAVLVNFFFENVAIVAFPTYMKYINRAELDGALRPLWIPSMQRMLGENSIMMLPGGRGHAKHKRLRGKILASLGSRNVLAMVPEILRLVRQTLDGLAAATASEGFATFEAAASELAGSVSTMMITAGLSSELRARTDALLEVAFQGIFTLPINLGPLTQFGRALRARKELAGIIQSIMETPNLDQRNIVADLSKPSADGDAFNAEEIVDTVFTLLVAGKATTTEVLPVLLVQLHEHRDWATRIAQEPLELKGVEEESSTLQVVRESLRIKPPVGAFRRVPVDTRCPVDLGPHGIIPPGCPIAVHTLSALVEMGADFNPDRWTPEVVREMFIPFGGAQPHACVGRALAMVELQLFARVLCQEYEFTALDPQLVLNPKLPVDLCYKDGLKVRVTRKTG